MCWTWYKKNINYLANKTVIFVSLSGIIVAYEFDCISKVYLE